MTANTINNPRLDFGKHKGQPIALVPSDYLKWMLAQAAIDPNSNLARWVKIAMEELKRRETGQKLAKGLEFEDLDPALFTSVGVKGSNHDQVVMDDARLTELKYPDEEPETDPFLTEVGDRELSPEEIKISGAAYDDVLDLLLERFQRRVDKEMRLTQWLQELVSEATRLGSWKASSNEGGARFHLAYINLRFELWAYKQGSTTMILTTIKNA
jgi:uncharacterized protein (DUF3820 family)